MWNDKRLWELKKDAGFIAVSRGKVLENEIQQGCAYSTVSGYHSACHIAGRVTIRDHTTQTEQHMRIGILVFKRAFEPCPVSPMSSEAFDYILSWLQKDQIDVLTGSFGLQKDFMTTIAQNAGAIRTRPFSQWVTLHQGHNEILCLTHPS